MSTLSFVLGVLLLYMSGLFFFARILKNNGVADVGYGIGFIVVVFTALLTTFPHSIYVWLLALLPLVWGLRLAGRIYLKNAGKPEDFRYKAWRGAWGKSFTIRSFLQIYMLQGIIIFIIAVPVTLSIVFPSSTIHPLFFFIGAALWGIGFYFESVADFELDRFIHDPSNKGKIMMSGLWHYSRHPNYFGESLMWWGIATAGIGLSEVWFIGFISPVLITFLLLKVSGVPLLEKRWQGNPAWEEYKKKTSVFIPLPPKR